MRKLYFLSLFVIFCKVTDAQISITTTTGGTNISADKAANALSPAFTTLGTIVLTETAVTNFPNPAGGGSFTLTAPSGWEFNPGVGSVTSSGSPTDILSTTITVTSTAIKVDYTTNTANKIDFISISGIQVRATNGANIPATGNIVFSSLTGAIFGITAGSTSVGTLSQTAGAFSKLIVTLPGQTFTDATTVAASGNTGTPTSQVSGLVFNISKIVAVDQFTNVVTSFSGIKTISYSAPASAVSNPSYTTSVSFTSGQSTTAIATTLRKAESVAITATNGTLAGTSSVITVQPASVSGFLVEAAAGGNIGNQLSGRSFNIKITAKDAENNLCTSGINSFSGTVVISSTGTFNAGSGTTAAFTSGILTHSVSISSAGNYTITAVKTSGSQSGTSNSFSVSCVPATLSGSLTNNTCFGSVSGSVLLSTTGGTSPFTYSWTGSNAFTSASQNISGLRAGTYSATVTSTGGCTATATFLITQPAQILPVLTSGSIACNGGSTYITVSATGGTGSYQYKLDNNNFGSSNTFTGVLAGVHSITVKDANNCTGTSSINISQPTVLTASSSIDSVISCYNGSTTITVSANGGTAPYSGTGSFTVSAGTYSYTVTDAKGCSAITSITVIQPEELIAPHGFGTYDVCPFMGVDTTITYSVIPVPAATSYDWTLPENVELVQQGDTFIRVKFNRDFTKGNIIVRSVNHCGMSVDADSIPVKRKVPIITEVFGPRDVCDFIGNNIPVTYYIDSAEYATALLWTVPAGVSIVSGQGTRTVQVMYSNAFTVGNIKVTASNNCSSYSAQTNSITRLNPATPAAIIGLNDVCSILGTTNTTKYYVHSVNRAVSYLWTVSSPSTMTIIGGQGDTAIYIRYSSAFVTGTVSVKTVTPCGSSAVRSLSIAKRIPSTPAIISGFTNVCPVIGSTTTYFIKPVANANSYTWTIPSGMNLISGQGDTLIKVAVTSSFVSGNVSVVASNNCYASAERSLAVQKLSPTTPATITGVTNVCNIMGTDSCTLYYTRKVNLATGYHWTLPQGAVLVANIGDTAIRVRFTSSFVSGSCLKVRAMCNCGCSADRSLAITMKAPVKPGTITVTGNACANTTATYSIAEVPFASSYVWSVPANAIISGQGTSTVTVTFPSGFTTGTVGVKAVNSYGASAINSIVVNAVCTGGRIAVSKPQTTTLETSMNVFPNPSAGTFSVTLNTTLKGEVKFILTDMFGKTLGIYNAISNGSVSLDINRNDLQNGVYQLQYSVGSVTETTRIIINK